MPYIFRSFIIALISLSSVFLNAMSLDKIEFPQYGSISVINLYGTVTIKVRNDRTLVFSTSAQPLDQHPQQLPWIKIEGKNMLGSLIFSKMLYFLGTERVDIAIHVPSHTHIDIEAAVDHQIKMIGNYKEEHFSVHDASQKTVGTITKRHKNI